MSRCCSWRFLAAPASAAELQGTVTGPRVRQFQARASRCTGRFATAHDHGQEGATAFRAWTDWAYFPGSERRRVRPFSG